MKAQALTLTAGLLLSLLTPPPAALGQAVAPTPAGIDDARPRAHDVRENDPSPGPQLALDGSVVDQKRFARSQLFRGIFLGEYFKQTAQKVFQKRYQKVLLRNPEWFDRLALQESRYVPQAMNGPAAINTDYEFEGISKRDYGYCWGFATIIRNFSVLAFFDPAQKPADHKGRELSPSADREAWLEFYARKIEDVAIYRKATVIPGFANLRELSLVPELELYLKLKAMHLWRWLAIRGAGFGTLLRSSRDLTRDQALSLLDELEARHRRHEMPKLIITSRARGRKPFAFAKSLHVVLSYGVERTPDGGGRIRVWDPNFYAESLARAPKEIVISADGEIRYDAWTETGTPDAAISPFLGRIELAHENNAETIDHLYELKRFCSAPDTARYCQP